MTDSTLRARRYAENALRVAARGDIEAAARTVHQLHARCGDKGLVEALVVWCDTAIEAQRKAPGPVRIGWLCLDTGRSVGDADQVPPLARWAGRLIAARAAGDRLSFIALAESVPDDFDAVAEHVGALLEMTVLIITTPEAGR